MNDLEKYLYSNDKKIIHKFAHYMQMYDRHFAHFRGTDVVVVEIGIGHGGSLQMWKNYFGPKAQIYGIDISPDAVGNIEDQIQCIQLDQGKVEDLRKLKRTVPKIDILIDDGSHYSKDQILTFEELFPHLSNNGVYVCEDLQTSYQHQFGGGYKKSDTLIEYAKNLVDKMNAWCAEDNPEFQKSELMRWTYAVHFYCYALVVEKAFMDQVLQSPVMTGAGCVRE